jgi:hypothetical protein
MSHNDKELLELAAKAAGVAYDAEASRQKPGINVFWGLWLQYEGEVGEYTPRYWNPLNSDRDALRLAVALKIDVRHYDQYVVAWFDSGTVDLPYGDDPLAATRRAIVCAAAELGKAMA